jgi:chromosomal replication initiation ATPase DnaA
MLDIPSRTAFELHHEIAGLKRSIAVLKARVRQLEQLAAEGPSVTARPRVKDILLMVSAMSYQPPMAIVSPRRDATVLRPRQVVCWLARRFTRRSLPEIARSLHRDHSTVLHTVRRMDHVTAALGRCPAEDTPDAWAELLLSVDPWP